MVNSLGITEMEKKPYFGAKNRQMRQFLINKKPFKIAWLTL